ncbi:MAG: hypothetical protein COV29_00830 [Candidatus Yanofskybacteria bacterium CG10_big_fil_rev_8_21_14_0_10_36_16]|uniref:Probable endolytic peptidoglycan transglycosylase RlpA n=1 Tax=Candidatus Yanofskybacteria bacterium CG10_big_fil_rev_8_21_14_0_10_36_16 TaxID=1975096 RepID=A0A2J0Q836_9BACT|nr:MAG: hypothetical protein COV29_00830 [Candidatus Yanofskybacteria bacterium CG10_big_fil_rev_8_21_14_0_10_36_16]
MRKWWIAIFGFILLLFIREVANKSSAVKIFKERTENTSVIKQIRTLKTSWYGPGFNKNRTANGEVFDQTKLTAAHKDLPFNTRLILTNPNNGKSTHVRINDRGPFFGDRDLDVSKEAAKKLGIIADGVVELYAFIVRSDGTVVPLLGD